MRRLIVVLGFALLSAGIANAQRTEVLYFKANLACCQAKACDTLEGTVKEIVEKNFDTNKVSFKEVKLADDSNKLLIEKHSAKSQTVVIVSRKGNNENAIDVSALVREFTRTQNKPELEKQLVAKLNEAIK